MPAVHTCYRCMQQSFTRKTIPISLIASSEKQPYWLVVVDRCWWLLIGHRWLLTVGHYWLLFVGHCFKVTFVLKRLRDAVLPIIYNETFSNWNWIASLKWPETLSESFVIRFKLYISSLLFFGFISFISFLVN